MTACPFTETAKKVAVAAGFISDSTLHTVSRWHLRLVFIGATIVIQNDDQARNEDRAQPTESDRRGNLADALRNIAIDAASTLFDLGVADPVAAFVAEWERAAVKHPGMTLDAGGHTDETRFYALAEEVGEVCAALTYDNALETGHNADLIAEVTQVGALALAWLTRYQDGGER